MTTTNAQELRGVLEHVREVLRSGDQEQNARFLIEDITARLATIDARSTDEPTIVWPCNERDELRKAIERGGLDLSPCRMCGLAVACIPDGLPFCDVCAEKENRR